MDMRYEQFCLADPVFYDSLARSVRPEESYVEHRPVPEGWLARRRDGWLVMIPPAATVPAQGWKVHVSATLDNAATVLDTVWDYCVARNISFKFLPDRVALHQCNIKYADRSASGKFITLYPGGLDELELALRELGAALDTMAGPYILSDARWGDGPLYLRYGGFAERYCRSADGDLVLAMAGPDGTLVPDPREPRFTVPDWVPVPAFLNDAVAARLRPDTTVEFPFQIERPLHFSNGGGVYLATDRTNRRRVVLREARPHAGLDGDGHDAVHRLLREREFLGKLAGSGVAPELYGYLTCWEHHFLVEEYVPGETLGRLFVQRYPLVRADATDERLATYTDWVLTVLAAVRRALDVLHGSGIAFGDLHPYNIIVTPDGQIRFVDFELASYLTDETRVTLGAPGYVPPDGRSGADADRYALASLTLSLFLPLTTLLPLAPGKARTLADAVAARFPVPPSLLADAVQTLRDRRWPPAGPAAGAQEPAGRLAAGLDAGEPDWPALRASIRDAILASATPQRADRLFPGDIEQFTSGGIGLAHGAAGVLYALARSGAGRFPEHERWLLDAALGAPDHRAGFYDGLHGVAYALAELDRLEDAMAVLESAARRPLDELPATLFGGLAGVGLNLLHFAALTGDAGLRARAVEVGERVARYRTEVPAPGGRPHAGLLLGNAGPALLYLRLYEAVGERRYLDLAEQALGRDLDQCVLADDGIRYVDEGWRMEPYLGHGSTGVGLVIEEFLRHRGNDAFAAALVGIRRAAEPECVIDAGLFAGRAGFIAALSWLDNGGDAQSTIDMHVRRLAWHIVPYQGHVAFAGSQSLRLSMDLATGSAGVLFALSALLEDDGPVLPFLVRGRR